MVVVSVTDAMMIWPACTMEGRKQRGGKEEEEMEYQEASWWPTADGLRQAARGFEHGLVQRERERERDYDEPNWVVGLPLSSGPVTSQKWALY